MVSLSLVINEELSIRLAVFVGIVSSFFLFLTLALAHRWATNLLFRGFSFLQPSMLLLMSFMVYNTLRFAFLLMGAVNQHMDVEDLIIPSVVYLFSSSVLIHLWAKFSNELGRLYCGTPPRRILLVPALGTLLLSILLAVSSQTCALLPSNMQDGCINASVAVDVVSSVLTGVALLVVSQDLQRTFEELSVDELLTSVQYHKGRGGFNANGDSTSIVGSSHNSANTKHLQQPLAPAQAGDGETRRNAALEQPKRLRKGVLLFGIYSVFRGPFILAFNFTGNYLNTTMSPGCVFYTVEAIALGISIRVLIGPPLMTNISRTNSSLRDRSLRVDEDDSTNSNNNSPSPPPQRSAEEGGHQRRSPRQTARQPRSSGDSGRDRALNSSDNSGLGDNVGDRGYYGSDRPQGAGFGGSSPRSVTNRQRTATSVSMDTVAGRSSGNHDGSFYSHSTNSVILIGGERDASAMEFDAGRRRK